MIEGRPVTLLCRHRKAKLLTQVKKELKGIDALLGSAPSITPTEEQRPLRLIEGCCRSLEISSCNPHNGSRKAHLADDSLDSFHTGRWRVPRL